MDKDMDKDTLEQIAANRMAFQEFWADSPEPRIEELFMELETVKQPAGESLTIKPKKKEHTKSQSTSWLGYTSTLFFILAIISLSWLLLLSYNQAEDVSPVAPSPVVETKYITKNIEDIRIGERTLGTNPQGIESSEADSEIFKKVKHHGYTLLYLKENQTLSVIELLRPENWLDTEYVQIRHVTDDRILTEAELDKLETADFDDEDYAFEVWIELPEMGVLGWAALVAIDNQVEIKDGPGNVVTGTFAHVSDNVMDLQLEGQDKPIGCTSNHPFWSVNRQDFVEAGELLEGEQVQLYNGETKRVIQKLPRPGPEIVYNLEVYAEHVYHVTQDGVLVHNICIRNKHLANKRHPVTNVPFDSEARPRFKVFRKVTIELSGSRKKDKRLADKALAVVLTKKWGRKVTAKEVRKMIQDEKRVWHHHKDGIMQLVDEKIHQLTGHTGGFSR